MPNIFRVMDLSTAHLPEDLCKDLNGFDGVIAHQYHEGWLLWVPADLDERVADYGLAAPGDYRDGGIPQEVVTLWQYGKQHDCTYILLDRDADSTPDLPTWEW